MLSPEEIRKLSDGIVASLEDEDKPFKQLSTLLARLCSHLESDQRVYIVLEKTTTDRMNKLEIQIQSQDKALFGDKENPEEHPGVVNELRDFRRFMHGNRKLHWLVATGVTGLILKSAWEVLSKHP